MAYSRGLLCLPVRLIRVGQLHRSLPELLHPGSTQRNQSVKSRLDIFKVCRQLCSWRWTDKLTEYSFLLAVWRRLRGQDLRLLWTSRPHLDRHLSPCLWLNDGKYFDKILSTSPEPVRMLRHWRIHGLLPGIHLRKKSLLISIRGD